MKNILKSLQGTKAYREVKIDVSKIDRDKRTAELSFSSDTPYERSWGWETLSHKSGAVLLDRIAAGAPLLLNHDVNQQIGVVESVEILPQENVGRAIVRFSKSQLGEEVWQDVLDEIRTGVSVGYLIHQMIQTKDIDGKPAYNVTKWEILELSVATIPADINIGFGRTNEVTEVSDDNIILEKESKKMEEQKTVPQIDVNQEREKIRREETKRVSEITAIAEKHGHRELAQQYIAEGKSSQEFGMEVLQKMGKIQPVDTTGADAKIGMSRKEVKKFSLVRAINAAADNDWSKAGFERECSQAVESKFGKRARGFFVPYDILKRDVDYDTEATDLVKTDLLAGDFINQLYAKTAVKNLGCRVLDGIIGNVDIPRMSGGATVYWQTVENTAVTESTPTFDKVSLTPHSMGAIVDVSKLLLNQSSNSVEQLLLDDMTSAIAVALDTAAINGANGSGEPCGVLNASINNGNITTSTGLTFGDVVNLETLVAIDNADFGSLAYLTSAKVRGYLKSHSVNATYGDMMMWQNGNNTGEGILNGYRAVATNVVPDTLTTNHSALIFGNWSDLILCLFAPGMDVTVDPFSGAKNRLVSLIVYMDVDIGIRHLNSFASAENILIS